MWIVKPDRFYLIVTRDDRKSIFLDGEIVPLPDFLLPGVGAQAQPTCYCSNPPPGTPVSPHL
ncbi:hypothetical protein MSSAC_1367 [Methanosarcina siciliae C2J]|uniref:Uncharacterized protein n=1 Tax=Methanosarcina siciliae C2J TaxID=1434118 RepID=A0A0E3PM17_9EURY|nr:hypothetical protein [Methanosarcina siciliae]AKB35957.1 hypothetical protein MSSAC_1367 [Methanosarcina siciliae C2J]